MVFYKLIFKFFSRLVPALSVYADRHVGLARQSNEDDCLTIRMGRDLALLLVADGSGEHQTGEIATKLVKERFLSLRKEIAFVDRLDASLETLSDLLRTAALEIHATVKSLVAKNSRLKGLSSTLTCCVVMGEWVAFVQVGDSRLYHLSEDGLTLRTVDKTLARDLVAAARRDGGKVPDHAESDSNSDYGQLSQAVGFVPYDVPLEPMVGTFQWRPGDALLLCTDGLTDYVADETIGADLARSTSPRAATASVIELALKAGGKDNIAVAVARWRA